MAGSVSTEVVPAGRYHAGQQMTGIVGHTRTWLAGHRTCRLTVWAPSTTNGRNGPAMPTGVDVVMPSLATEFERALWVTGFKAAAAEIADELLEQGSRE